MFIRSLIRVSLIMPCLLLTNCAFAQISSWHYTANTGYETIDSPSYSVRWEDVYFTDTLTGFGVTGSGRIGKTTDGGENWNMFFDDLHYPDHAQFRCIEFLDDGLTGIAGSVNRYTLRTTDGGSTWLDISDNIPITDSSHIPNDMKDDRMMCGLAHKGNNFYGVGWWGGNAGMFYKSTDRGVTWKVSHTDLATNLVDVVFISENVGFVSGGMNKSTVPKYQSAEAVVLKTTDGGASWTKVFSDSLLGGRIWKIQYVNEHLMVGSMEPYYFPDTVNMIKSIDGGNTWQVIHVKRFDSTNKVRFTQQGVGFVSSLTGFIGGYGDGMMQTHDGGLTWDTLSFGRNVNRIFVLDSTHAYAGGSRLYRWGHDIDTISHNPVPAITNNRLYPLYPNPAKGEITITFDIGVETNVVLEVANVSMRRGEQLLNKRLSAGRYTYKWDPVTYPNGDYIIWLGTDEIPLTQKFVLQR